MVKASIPKEDLAVINAALRGGNAQAIKKGPRGEFIKAVSRPGIASSYEFKDYSGRIVKFTVSVYIEGKTVVVAEPGQRYDEIPLDKRNLVTWFDNYFQ